jgi:preprotein translocase subunit SecG
MFWTNLLIDILLPIFVIDCLFMGLVIMMQRSKQEGLGASFGQAAMGEILGTGVSKFLVTATVYATIIFFVLSIVLARLYSYRNAEDQLGSSVQQELSKPVPAATTPATTTPAAPATTPASPAPVAPAPASAPTAPAAPASK